MFVCVCVCDVYVALMNTFSTVGEEREKRLLSVDLLCRFFVNFPTINATGKKKNNNINNRNKIVIKLSSPFYCLFFRFELTFTSNLHFFSLSLSLAFFFIIAFLKFSHYGEITPLFHHLSNPL